jgi:hypothetical protein
VPGQARLSVRQSPLVHGRFSFQDGVKASVHWRPITRPKIRGWRWSPVARYCEREVEWQMNRVYLHPGAGEATRGAGNRVTD